MELSIIIAQIIGIIAIIVYSLSPHQKTNSKVLIVRLIAAVLYAIQYLLLGAYTAVFTNLIGGVKEGVFYLYNRKNKNIPFMILILYSLILIISGVITYTNIFSIMPVILAILTAYATWCGDLRKYRLFLLLSSVTWLVYNFMVGAYVSFAGNIFQLFSSIFAMVRFDLKTKKVDNK